MKEKKGRRGPLDPDDVLAGRVRPEAPLLIALIRDVNPTGRGLPTRQMELRYAQKSRLQSVLIARFQDEITVRAAPNEPGVVSLIHRPSGLDACHAIVSELDDDARSWVQLRLDLDLDVDSSAAPPPPAPQAPAHARAPGASADNKRKAHPHEDEGNMGVSELLAAGREATLSYEYDVARERFEAAVARSGGAAEPAGALLSLLVDHLAADEEALALEARLSGGALGDPSVRVLLALAAARRSERERAFRLLNEHGGARRGPAHDLTRRAEPRAAQVAEVFIALARSAIESGQLADAADDLAKARERAPLHPEIQSLEGALAKRRAAAREPAEAELSRLFTAGDIAGAERAARELLARWPDSDTGRRITRAVSEHRRQEQADQLLASAREALAHGETMSGLALLRRALAGGLRSEDAAWAERRIAAIEEEARAREEQARIEDVGRLVIAGDLARGLPAYVSLNAQERQAVRGASGSNLLVWLEDLAPHGSSAKAVIPAVLALGRAAEIAARDPSAALDGLGAHAKVLQGFKPAEEVEREARRALADLRRSAARRAILAARHALAEGQPDRADENLREAPLADLPDDERAAADDLWAAVRKLLERQLLATSLEQSRREGDELRALGVLEKLLALTEEADKPALEALRSELRDVVQRRFCVEVESFPEGIPDPLWDARVSPEQAVRMLLPAPTETDPEARVLVLVQATGDHVFLRILDVASMRILSRATLRPPAALELLTMSLLGRHLFLIGKRGALLEIAVDSFHVVRWCPNVLRNGTAFSRSIFKDAPQNLRLPEELIEEAVITPDGRSLWLYVLGGPEIKARSTLHVLDLDQLRPIREFQESRGGEVHIQQVAGLKAPRVAVIRGDDSTRLHDTRGLPTGEIVTGVPLDPGSFTACPDGEHTYATGSDPASPKDPMTATWVWVEIAQGPPSPLRIFDGVTAVYGSVAVTSLDAGMTFVLFQLLHRGCELFGLREGNGGGLEIAYRATLPRRSTLLGDPSSRRAAVLIARDDGAELLDLGATPPTLPGGSVPESAPFRLPSVPTATIHMAPIDCFEPTGARLTAAKALYATLKREPARVLMRRLDATRHKASVEELLNLEAALLMLKDPSNAGLIGARAWARFPKHPRVRLGQARSLTSMGRWSEALDLLSSLDPGALDKGEVKHMHHLLGIVLMMLGDPDGALVELKRSEACDEGTCDLGLLIAVCTPLSDTSTTWTPEQAVLRDLMARIASADAALARGDATSARRSLECLLVWEAYEVQSMARLAEAYLLEEEAGAPCDSFRRTLTLVSYCDLFATRGTFTRREMPLPRIGWDAPRLSAVAARARRALTP